MRIVIGVGNPSSFFTVFAFNIDASVCILIEILDATDVSTYPANCVSVEDGNKNVIISGSEKSFDEIVTDLASADINV